MSVSRPVVAFALLKECSEVLRTDLLGGISLLVRPLIGDLGGQRFSSEILKQRISSNYGMAISSQALTEFLPRFIAAGIVVERKTSESTTEAVFADFQSSSSQASADDENGFQSIFDSFLEFCGAHLSTLGVSISNDDLISGLLTRLATFDFRSIEVKPDRTNRDKATPSTIAGPSTKEDVELEKLVSADSKLDILVAAFVNFVAVNNPSSLELLVKVAEGALGAELVFDLRAPKIRADLSKVTIVLDSPILLSLLDLSDKQHQIYAEELVAQVRNSHATLAAFRHSIDEAEGVLDAVKKGALLGRAYGPTAERLRVHSYYAYFETMIGSIERRLIDLGIKIIEPTTAIHNRFFTEVLQDELVNHLRFHIVDRRLARERDAQSIGETVRLREGAHVPLEELGACKYMFLTSNPALQEQARTFLLSNKLIDKNEFSPIITDRYFAGLAWLLFGGATEKALPMAKLLANCATALRSRPDVISRTRSFLAAIDPKKAEHFEALMTKERAARYLTEIVLGDSLLITAENAEQIYEKLEAIAAEKVARAKDEHYGKLLDEKQKTLDSINHELMAATFAVDSLEKHAADQAKNLQSHEKTVAQLSEQLAKEEEQSQRLEQSINLLQSDVKSLSEANRLANEAAARIKRASVSRALKLANRTLWSIRFIVLAFFLAASFLLGYCDKFIIPKIPQEYQTISNYLLIAFQVILGAVGFWVFTDRLFGRIAWQRSRKTYDSELLSLGYDNCEPEFKLNFEEFTLKDASSTD